MERKPAQRKMRAIAVIPSLILSSFKFEQYSAVPASLPWHIRENCDDGLEPLNISHLLCLKESGGKKEAVIKHYPSVTGVEVIVFSVS